MTKITWKVEDQFAYKASDRRGVSKIDDGAAGLMTAKAEVRERLLVLAVQSLPPNADVFKRVSLETRENDDYPHGEYPHCEGEFARETILVDGKPFAMMWLELRDMVISVHSKLL